MKTLAVKLLRPWIKKYLVDMLEKRQVKITEAINRKLDLPKLDEVQEARLINSAYDFLQEAISILIK